VTFDDSGDARSALAGFISFCGEFDVPLHVAANRRDAESVLEVLQPELCLVVGWYWLLNQNLIDNMRHGAVGVHNSLLPKYRGGSPLVWALINGETEAGCSLFSFTNEMDAGNIWLQCAISLTQEDDISSAQHKIEQALRAQLELHWCSILDGTLNSYTQHHDDATYCAQRFPDDGQIDWGLSSARIHNLIRAQAPPYPGAFTIWEGKHITLLSAKLFSAPYYGTPGQVARVVPGEGVYIVCGDSRAIIVRKVLVDGHEYGAEEIFTSIKIRLNS
jgi:methionyl-tRNA formyltransferase